MSFDALNELGCRREPFLFICDFKAEKIEVLPLQDLKKEDVEFSIDAQYRFKQHPHYINKFPSDFNLYKEKFDSVIEHIKAGNTYVLNLTQETKVVTSLSLKEIYNVANAHYKLRFKDEFVCFSPESFIQIEGKKISTFPMKGTIDASTFDASKKILEDKKEMAEHIMIVDLLRNDLSIVAKNVQVEKFRFLTEIEAGDKKLLQVSSHISGELEVNWHENIGTILHALLPAGSISGAPKKSTLEIIESLEGYQRGFFSGVFGIYDGERVDSGVMIRFIEKKENSLVYKSGGGITLDSNVDLEYKELLDKIYLP